jgi:hypothetical protein
LEENGAEEVIETPRDILKLKLLQNNQ